MICRFLCFSLSVQLYFAKKYILFFYSLKKKTIKNFGEAANPPNSINAFFRWEIILSYSFF